MAGVYGEGPARLGAEPATVCRTGHTSGVIVTIVRFPRLDRPVDLDEARARFGANAVTYLDVPGLLWKAYLRSEDGRRVGGVYWWRDRASAETRFDEDWRRGVTDKYGAPPEIEWFDAPVVVDNRPGVLRTEAPPD
jgi:hypothetical protein